MNTKTIFLRVNRKDIAYFKFIMESHEGIAVVRTNDPKEAVIELMVAPGCEREVEKVIEELKKEIVIERA